MKKRVNETTDIVPRLLNTDELMAYSGLGRNKSVELGDEIGARVQVGRRVLWDRLKIDQYINSLTEVN